MSGSSSDSSSVTYTVVSLRCHDLPDCKVPSESAGHAPAALFGVSDRARTDGRTDAEGKPIWVIANGTYAGRILEADDRVFDHHRRTPAEPSSMTAGKVQ